MLSKTNRNASPMHWIEAVAQKHTAKFQWLINHPPTIAEPDQPTCATNSSLSDTVGDAMMRVHHIAIITFWKDESEFQRARSLFGA